MILSNDPSRSASLTPTIITVTARRARFSYWLRRALLRSIRHDWLVIAFLAVFVIATLVAPAEFPSLVHGGSLQTSFGDALEAVGLLFGGAAGGYVYYILTRGRIRVEDGKSSAATVRALRESDGIGEASLSVLCDAIRLPDDPRDSDKRPKWELKARDPISIYLVNEGQTGTFLRFPPNPAKIDRGLRFLYLRTDLEAAIDTRTFDLGYVLEKDGVAIECLSVGADSQERINLGKPALTFRSDANINPGNHSFEVKLDLIIASRPLDAEIRLEFETLRVVGK